MNALYPSPSTKHPPGFKFQSFYGVWPPPCMTPCNYRSELSVKMFPDWIKALCNIGGTLLSNHTHFLRNLISESHKNSDLQTFVTWWNIHGKLEHTFLHKIQGKFNMFCNLHQICNQLKSASRFCEGKKFSTLFNWTAFKHEVQTIKMIVMAK